VNLKNRGKRVEEQLDVMRRLWSEELLTYEGQWHRVPDAGLNPLPVQRPIPVWMGGESEAVLRRAARLADGWITLQTFRRGRRPSRRWIVSTASSGRRAAIPPRSGSRAAWPSPMCRG